MIDRSVILIGMPGSGKSTVGKRLASVLGVDFCDTDDLIIQKTGEPLQVTIDSKGREAFLEEESLVLLDLKALPVRVISTGGSVVLHKEAMEHLKQIGTLVFLDADLPLLRQRLWNVDSRGIIFNDNDEDIFNVYKEREREKEADLNNDDFNIKNDEDYNLKNKNRNKMQYKNNNKNYEIDSYNNKNDNEDFIKNKYNYNQMKENTTNNISYRGNDKNISTKKKVFFSENE